MIILNLDSGLVKKMRLKKMKQIIITNIFILIFFIVVPEPSYSNEFTFEPRLMMGWMFYEFTDKLSPLSDDFTLNDNDFYLGVGTTLTHKKYYCDLYWLQTGNFSDSPKDKNETGVVEVNDNPIYNYKLNKSMNSEFDRNDFSIALGKKFDNYTLFIGYKKSVTTFDLLDSSEAEERFRPHDLSPYYNNKISNSSASLDYENSCFYIGAGLTYPWSYGIIAVKLALSSSNIKVMRNYSEGIPGVDTNDIIDETADRVFTKKKLRSDDNGIHGMSFGISLKGPVMEYDYISYDVSFNTFKLISDTFVEDTSFCLYAEIRLIYPFIAYLDDK